MPFKAEAGDMQRELHYRTTQEQLYVVQKRSRMEKVKAALSMLIAAVTVASVIFVSLNTRGSTQKDNFVLSRTERQAVCKQADVVFVLDSSGSVNTDEHPDNWDKVLWFVRDIVSTFNIGLFTHQVSLINYGNKARVQFNLNEHLTLSALDLAIGITPWKNQRTNTSGAIWRMIHDVFVSENGDRPGVANIALVITDGNNNLDSDLLKTYSDTAHQTIEVFVIGVSNLVNDTELQMIASFPPDKYRKLATDFVDLSQHKDILTTASCDLGIGDPCDAKPCINGDCISRGSVSFSCLCHVGFTGDRCQRNIDDCSPNPCRNGGTCMDGVGVFSCSCARGFVGSLCQSALIGDPCDPNPCENGAECTATTNTSVTCICQAGYTGTLCQTSTDVNECASTPCQNGGTCRVGANGFTCTCPSGVSGVLCENNSGDKPNACQSTPCLNEATCFRRAFSGFYCQCGSGFYGMICEYNINECNSIPCRNGATCVDGIASYQCICSSSFAGPDCSTEKSDRCSSKPCQNGGQCFLSGGDGFYCQCNPGSFGTVCEFDLTTTSTMIPTTTTTTTAQSMKDSKTPDTTSDTFYPDSLTTLTDGNGEKQTSQKPLSTGTVAALSVCILLLVVVVGAVTGFVCYRRGMAASTGRQQQTAGKEQNNGSTGDETVSEAYETLSSPYEQPAVRPIGPSEHPYTGMDRPSAVAGYEVPRVV